MTDPMNVVVTFQGITYRGTLQPDAPTPPSPPPHPPVRRTFSVFTGAAIPGNLRNERMLASAIRGLCPWPSDEVNLEWWVKAGEGGSWEGEWDSHSLAIGSEDDLKARRDAMAHNGVRIVPWVNLRGRPEWEAGEHEIIRACAGIVGTCGLNLEPGESYWNGPTDSGGVGEWIDRLGLRPDQLWLIGIPRFTAAAELGGAETMRTWLSKVGGASWECYDATAPDLSPDLALPRVGTWTASPWHRIPIVQRSRIGAWQDSHWADQAMQVWTVDGD